MPTHERIPNPIERATIEKRFAEGWWVTKFNADLAFLDNPSRPAPAAKRPSTLDAICEVRGIGKVIAENRLGAAHILPPITAAPPPELMGQTVIERSFTPHRFSIRSRVRQRLAFSATALVVAGMALSPQIVKWKVQLEVVALDFIHSIPWYNLYPKM